MLPDTPMPNGCEYINKAYESLLQAHPHAAFKFFITELEKKFEPALVGTWKAWKEPYVRAAEKMIRDAQTLSF